MLLHRDQVFWICLEGLNGVWIFFRGNFLNSKVVRDAWAKHKDLDPYEAKWRYVEALLKVG